MKYFLLILFLFFDIHNNSEAKQIDTSSIDKKTELQTNTANNQSENKLFQEIIQKYKNSSGVIMNFQKKTHLKILQKTRKSSGKIFLSQGLMKLEIKDSMNTEIIFDKTHLWYKTSTPDGKIKTVKIDFKNKVKNKAIVSFLFNPDLFFQVFRFVSSRSKGRATIFEFLPIQKTENISRFSIKIEGDRILLVQVEWKDLNTLEEYTFSDIRMNQKIPAKAFKAHKSG